jgi:two-component system sensor histidine kinase KdpD
MTAPLSDGVALMISPRIRPFTGYAVSAAFALAAGLVAQGLSVWLGVTQLSFVFMTSVILAGAFFGARPAILAALVAFCIYNFFLVEPQFSLRLASADDFTALVLFLAAAVVTGGLAGRLRDQAQISARRLRTTQALFEASRRLSDAVEAKDIYRGIADSTALALSAPTLVLTRTPSGTWNTVESAPATFHAHTDDVTAAIEALKASADPLVGATARWRAALMQGRRGPLGALAVQTSDIGYEHDRALTSLAGLGAVALERVALISEMAEAQALAESERLRAALLSSLSHDFRTPLAAILASSTSLIEYGDTLAPEARRDLLSSIRDETNHMTRFVANLLDMTRLEAGALKPSIAATDLSEVVVDASGHVARHAAAKGIRIDCSGPTIFAAVDAVLLERALMNILENAVHFSDERAVVAVAVAAENGSARISVTDAGPGINPIAMEHIFDKFFRAEEHAGQRRGAGLGLSIARGLIEAMNGAVQAESPVANGRGARFTISFPLAALNAP